MTDILDSRLIFVGSYINVTYASATRILTWTIASINSGDNITLSFIVRINGSGIINNTVVVSTPNENNVGNNNTTSSNTNVIDPENTTVKIGSNSTITAQNGTVGQQITINGVAKDVNGRFLANVKLTVIVDGKTYTVTTDNVGVWNLYYTPTTGGILVASVSWNGNSTHNGFVNSTSFIAKENKIVPPKVKKNTTLLLEVDGDGSSAILTDEDGNLLANKKIAFRIKGVTISIGITNEEGIAVIYYKDAYRYNVKARFGGDSDYAPSNSEYISEYTSEYSKSINSISGIATMKKTGIPIIAVLLALLASISLVGCRKRK